MRHAHVIARLGFALCICGASTALADNWTSHSHDRHGTAYQQAETLIGPDTIDQVEVIWTADDLEGTLVKAPAVIDGVAYVTTDGIVSPFATEVPSMVYMIDMDDGTVLMARELADIMEECLGRALAPDEVFGNQTAPTINGNSLVLGTMPYDTTSYVVAGVPVPFEPPSDGLAYVVRIDRHDLSCLGATHVSSAPWEGILSTVTVFGGSAFYATSGYEESLVGEDHPCCSTVGQFGRVDLATGERVWSRYTVDADTTTLAREESAGELDLSGITGVTIWGSPFVIDNSEQLVVATVGNAYSGPDNPIEHPEEIPPENLPIDSIIAFDMQTGDIAWAYRAIDEERVESHLHTASDATVPTGVS